MFFYSSAVVVRQFLDLSDCYFEGVDGGCRPSAFQVVTFGPVTIVTCFIDCGLLTKVTSLSRLLQLRRFAPLVTAPPNAEARAGCQVQGIDLKDY